MKTDPRLSTVRSQLKKERPNPALKCRESKMQDEDDPPQTSTARLFYAKHGFERAGAARPFQIRLDDSSIGSDEDRRRQLSHVEITVGPAHGAEMLLAGIRTIHARHPISPRHEFITQVLATGSARQP